MATVPLSGTDIRLLSGIPFSSDYKHTRWFDSLTDQLNWFSAKTIVHEMTQATFIRTDDGKSFVRVDKSIDELYATNYMMFNNFKISRKWFYAFITKLEYKNSNCTYVYFEIDVMQTWRFDFNFRPSYVVREHCPLWNSDGTPVINTQDEGLNYGTEYDNVHVENVTINGGYKWLVIISKSTLHQGSTAKAIVPTVVGTTQPLTYYIVPFMDDDSVPVVDLGSSTTVSVSKPSEILKNLYTNTDAVNQIVSIYITDYVGFPVTLVSGVPDTLEINTSVYDIQEAIIQDTSGANDMYCLYVNKVISFSGSLVPASSKYDGYTTVTESKLLMYPYTLLVADDFRGNRQIYKNEYINNTQLNIVFKGGMGTSNNVTYGIDDYNFAFDNSNAPFPKDKISDESALINNNANDVPVIVDMLSAYLQGNKNSLANQKNAITFDMNMGMVGSGLGLLGSALSGNALGVASSVSGAVKGGGDGLLKMQGMLAKQKDIANIPPSIAKMGSNTAYSFGNGFNGLYLIKKQIKPEYITKLTSFFNMYGYKMNEVKYPNFHTRENWNYVQTQNCSIQADFNNEDLNEMKSIFDAGITLWHNDDIGNYTLTNGVI